MREVVGHVISHSTPRRVLFVALKGAKVALGDFYLVDHPWKRVPVFLRARDIQTINEEVDLGRTGLIASSSGLISDYSSELEYIVVECEVLGYRDPESGKIKGLESPPSTLSPVSRPTRQDMASFLGMKVGWGLPIKVGRVKGTDVPFHLDLSSIARGHMFVTGMTRSGKSVTGDTVIVLWNKEKRKYYIGPIKSFIDPLLPRQAKRGIVDLRGWEYYTPTLKPGMVPSWGRVVGALRHVNDKDIYEIETATGKKIRVTEDHSLLVTPDGIHAIPVTPKTLMAMKSRYLISPRGMDLPEPKSDFIYMDRLIGIALASGIPDYEGKGVVIMDSSPAEVKIACLEAGVDCKFYGYKAALVRSELLMDAIANGLVSIMNLPSYNRHFTGIDMFPRFRALREYLKRKTLPLSTNDYSFIFVMEDERRLKELSTIMSLLGVTVLKHCNRGLRLEPFTASELRSRLEVPEYYARASDGPQSAVSIVKRRTPMRGVIQRGKVDLERIISIRKVYTVEEFVYDLEVAGTNNFLANGVFVHNSSFVSSLIAKSTYHNPKPRFLVLDRRGEYSGLTKRGGVIYDYSAFLPKHGLLRPGDIARKLGYRQGTVSHRLILEAARESMAEGEEPDLDDLRRSLRQVAREMKIRSSLVAEIDARLRREFKGFVARGEGLDIVDEVRKNPLVIVDFSTDTRYDDQFYAVRDIIRRLTSYAVSRRQQGDFALIVVVEEAQYLVPERGYNIVGDPYEAGAAQAVIEAISQAGGYNLGFIIVTQRPAYVSKSVISQANTIAAFRLRNGNDQDAILRYTEVEDLSNYLAMLSNHEALVWGMASPIPFPVQVEMEVVSLPMKASSRPEDAWAKM